MYMCIITSCFVCFYVCEWQLSVISSEQYVGTAVKILCPI